MPNTSPKPFTQAPTSPHVVWWHRATVLRIVDGDTIDVELDRAFNTFERKKRIRIARIDCPDYPDKVGKHAATQNLINMLPNGAEVMLYTHKDKTGMYGRLIADVIYNGKNLGEEQIKSGHAVMWGK